MRFDINVSIGRPQVSSDHPIHRDFLIKRPIKCTASSYLIQYPVLSTDHGQSTGTAYISTGTPLGGSTIPMNTAIMLELEHRFRVVDINVSLSTDEDVAVRGRRINANNLTREMNQAGVSQAVVSPIAPRGSDYLTANNAIARMAVGRPFVTFARINGPRSGTDGPTDRVRDAISSRESHHTDPSEIEQYGYDDRFYGFVIDPPRDGIPDEETLDTIESVDLPVLVRGGEFFPPERAADLLLSRSFPTILAHFGGHPMNRDLMNQAIDLLDKYDEAYLDTSFVRYRDLLERALLEHPDRVLFGSGTPTNHPNVGVMELLTLDVSEDKMRRAFEKNPRRVLPDIE